jgi:uroporphyrinogen decarboxylase
MAVKKGEALTSFERMMMVLDGEKPDQIPVWPMVRDWCLRQVGFKVSEAMHSAEKYVYAQYFCMRQFGYDAVRDFAGIHAESEAMGSKLKIPDDDPPSVEDFAVKDYDRDLSRLRIPNPWKDGRLPMLLEGTKRLKELCGASFPVISYIQAPFRHASMLRGSDEIMKDTYKRPDKVKDLLEITTASQIVYGIACVHAGADIIFISDPTSSGDAISVKTWEEFGFPYISRVVREIKKTGVKMIMHICGDTTDRLESMALTGVDCLSLDQKVDLGYARNLLGQRVCLMGNVDPTYTLPFKKPEEVEEESKQAILKAGMNGSFILCSGCGVPAITPPENIRAMVRAARNEEGS